MGNWASRLGCLGERRSRLKAGPKAQEGPTPSADLQGLHPPGVSWAWWGTHAIQVTEVTETVVTETVVTEAVEVGPGQQGRQPTQAPPELLNTLQSWLDGMEELQASQGPLAADATVAAAQLQEQELLQCLLEERAPQIEPRLREAGSPAKLCAQWHRLVQWAETRLGVLQQLVPAAQNFDAAHETLLARLGPGERLLAELGQGQLGPTGQERVMQCLQRVCKGATACAEDLGRALETGQRLAELLAGEWTSARSLRWANQACQDGFNLLQPLILPDPQSKFLQCLCPCLVLKGPSNAHVLVLACLLACFAEDEARIVNQQLEGLQECVKLTLSGAVRVWQMLLCAQKIGSCELLPPTGLEAQLDLEGVASEGPGLKDQEELSVQLAQLSEWLEQLASQAEAPGQAVAPMVPIQEQCLPPSTLGASRVQPGLEFSWGQQTLVVSWPWRGPEWQGGINFEGTCHLSLLMNLPGSQAAMSCPPRERSAYHLILPTYSPGPPYGPHLPCLLSRPLNLEGPLLLIGHLLEEPLTCPHGLSQAEPLRTKVGPMTRSSHLHSDFVEQPRVAHAQGWRLEVLPAVLGADRWKPWTAVPVQVLAQRGPDQAGLLGVSLEELSWRLPRAEATKGSWNHRKLETRERSWQDKDHPEQDLIDNVLASDEQGKDGLGCLATSGGHEPTSQVITMLVSELPNGQQLPPHSMARAGDTDGNKHTGCQRWVHSPGSLGEQVARGALMVRVGGGWVALDEFLVKNDPGRAKGRTSHKIHERFQCCAGAQKSRRAQDIITLRLWASIPSASSRPLPRKVKATERPKEQKPGGHQDPGDTGQKAVCGIILRGLSRSQRTGMDEEWLGTANLSVLGLRLSGNKRQ
ncbi:uncharacterized protein LOC101709785 isoform X2 [Heterocephalus glaber]|uniref:Uncharacterized protein LOC101709785 isoform X2 n=1 Tax=Heterocephalus glaber TaxID=10181 RepID=A0AAX6SF01_HETGA|nr:uncharacterized protein LOC101709785 isoform X2 [Heterocephalus glaber]